MSENLGRLIHSIANNRYKKGLGLGLGTADYLEHIWWEDEVSKWTKVGYKDSYYRRDPWGRPSMRECVQWCMKQFGPNNFDITPYFVDKKISRCLHFKNPKDMVYFKMVWG